MNKQPPMQFQFLYPITDFTKTPAVHLLDLYISGTVETGREGEVLGINILKINHIAKGEIFASDIKYFLKYTNPELHKQIFKAALSHATEVFGLKPHVILS